MNANRLKRYIALVMALAMLFLLCACSSSKERLLDKYSEAVFASGDADSIMACYPDAFNDSIADVLGYDNKDKLREGIESIMNDKLDEFAEEHEVERKNIDVCILDYAEEQMDEDALKEFNENVNDTCKIDIVVEEAVNVNYTLTVEADGDVLESTPVETQLMKVQGDWYVFDLRVFLILALETINLG